MAVETKKHCAQVSATCILNYRNTQYNNLFNKDNLKGTIQSLVDIFPLI